MDAPADADGDGASVPSKCGDVVWWDGVCTGTVSCQIATPCGDSCFAVCEEGKWALKCTPCDAKPAGCPPAAPADGTPCDAKGVACAWNGCAATGQWALGKCDGTWKIASVFCAFPGCPAKGGEDPPMCKPGNVCAASVCGGAACIGTDGAWAICGDPPGPVGGGVVSLAVGQPAVHGLAADATHAYWYAWTRTDTRVRRVPLAGGPWSDVVLVAPGPLPGWTPVVAFGDRVHFTAHDPADPANWAVLSVPAAGGPVEVVAGGQAVVTGIAVDPAAVTFATGIDPSCAEVRRKPK